MKSFKEFFITETTKKIKSKKKSKSQADLISNRRFADGEDINTFLTRKAGPHQSKKTKDYSNQRKAGKDIAKRAMRGDY